MRSLKLFTIADHYVSLRSLSHSDDFDTLEDLNDIRCIYPEGTLCEIAKELKYFYTNKSRGSKPMSDFTFNINSRLPEKKADSLSYIAGVPYKFIYIPSVNKNEYMEWIILTDMKGW